MNTAQPIPFSVCLDAEPLAYPMSGIGVYLTGLLRELERHPDAISPHLYLTTCSRKTTAFICSSLKTLHLHSPLHVLFTPGRIASWFPSRLTKRLSLPRLPAHLRLFHATSYLRPPWQADLGLPTIITIHDLAFLRERQERFGPPEYTAMLRKQLPLAVAKAAAIITVSEFTKRETIRLLGVPAEKIWVTPLGPQWDAPQTVSPRTLATVQSLLTPYGVLPGRYILSVSTLSPRKNTGTLLQAFASLIQRYPDARLVLVGKQGWDVGDLIRQLQSPPPGVTWLPHVSPSELAALYCHARAFALVSWYEGFGIPVLEAMQCGCPVVYATGSAMDEVVGDAGLPVPPSDAATIAAAMERLWSDSILVDELRNRGHRQAARFTWEYTAKLTMQAYSRCQPSLISHFL